jgi:hypothetical protein
MKKHFEQAIAFDRDNPLNQRTGLGKKYNELVDEYNTLEDEHNALVEKYNKAVGIEVISTEDEIEEAQDIPADEVESTEEE